MHILRLNIEDSVFGKVLYFLKNLPKNEVVIVEDTFKNQSDISKVIYSDAEVKAFSNHSSSLIEEWKDKSEDEVWK